MYLCSQVGARSTVFVALAVAWYVVLNEPIYIDSFNIFNFLFGEVSSDCLVLLVLQIRRYFPLFFLASKVEIILESVLGLILVEEGPSG